MPSTFLFSITNNEQTPSINVPSLLTPTRPIVESCLGLGNPCGGFVNQNWRCCGDLACINRNDLDGFGLCGVSLLADLDGDGDDGAGEDAGEDSVSLFLFIAGFCDPTWSVELRLIAGGEIRVRQL
jgi:hypothetical protein